MDVGRQFNNKASQVELHHEEFHKHLTTNRKAWEAADLVDNPDLQGIKEKSSSRAKLHADHYKRLTGKDLIEENDTCTHCGESTAREND